MTDSIGSAVDFAVPDVLAPVAAPIMKAATVAVAPVGAAHYAAAKYGVNAATNSQKKGMDEAKANVPGIPALPALPNSTISKQARSDEAARLRRFKGTGSTVLTGSLGTTGDATVQKKTLLGQ